MPSYDTRCCNNGKSILLGGKPWCPVSCETQSRFNDELQAKYNADIAAYEKDYRQCLANGVQSGTLDPDGNPIAQPNYTMIYVAGGLVALLLVIYVVIRVLNR